MRLSRFVSAAVVLALGAVLTVVGVRSSAAEATGYAALGDSYSSGVGAGSYTDESGDCRRSTKAYPQLWAKAHSPSSFTFAACSGAETSDVINKQLGGLDENTGLVSVSIGGNDAEFVDVMTTCVLNSEKTCLARVDQARAFVNEQLPDRLDQVYSAIRGKAPNARVVVLGYPRIYKLDGVCVAGISEKKRAALNDAADLLNSVIAARTAAARFTFGDVRTTFSGHEICSGSSWLHSVAWPIYHSYHPTADGQSGGYLPALTEATG